MYRVCNQNLISGLQLTTLMVEKLKTTLYKEVTKYNKETDLPSLKFEEVSNKWNLIKNFPKRRLEWYRWKKKAKIIAKRYERTLLQLNNSLINSFLLIFFISVFIHLLSSIRIWYFGVWLTSYQNSVVPESGVGAAKGCKSQ